MRAPHLPSGAPDEGALVAILHGEDGTGSLARHVDTCARCGEALRALSEREDRVRRLLLRADLDPPEASAWEDVLQGARARAAAARRRRVALRVAAVLVAVVGAAVASPQLRAWVASRWTAPAETPEPSSGESPAGSAALQFAVGGPVLVVDFPQPPAHGVLTLDWSREASAAMTVSGGGTEEWEIGGGLVRIGAAPRAGATYRLVVPAGVEEVEVRLGAERSLRYSRSGASEDSTVVVLEAR